MKKERKLLLRIKLCNADKHADISSPSTYEDSAILHYSAVPDFPILNYPAGSEASMTDSLGIKDAAKEFWLQHFKKAMHYKVLERFGFDRGTEMYTGAGAGVVTLEALKQGHSHYAADEGTLEALRQGYASDILTVQKPQQVKILTPNEHAYAYASEYEYIVTAEAAAGEDIDSE